MCGNRRSILNVYETLSLLTVSQEPLLTTWAVKDMEQPKAIHVDMGFMLISVAFSICILAKMGRNF